MRSDIEIQRISLPMGCYYANCRVIQSVLSQDQGPQMVFRRWRKDNASGVFLYTRYAFILMRQETRFHFNGVAVLAGRHTGAGLGGWGLGNEHYRHNEVQPGPHLDIAPEQHESCRHAGPLPKVHKTNQHDDCCRG